MIIQESKLRGAFVLEPERHYDERGFFARTFCRREFETAGLESRVAQCAMTFNVRAGTLRGLHYQVSPHAEAKLVSCIRGEIFDVILDLRPEAATRWQWFGLSLSAENGKALYVPEGFAHGYLTLTDDAVVHYQMSKFYHPESARGLRWNDPALGIKWPREPEVISTRDRSYELLPTPLP